MGNFIIQYGNDIRFYFSQSLLFKSNLINKGGIKTCKMFQSIFNFQGFKV
jgi:hypothetical protein